MRPKSILIDPDATDADGLFTVGAVSGAGALTLDGAFAGTTFDYARRIGILSAGTDTGITFTIVGTDADGLALTEIVTGGDGATVESTGYFKTVTSITASGAAAGNVTIGTVDEFVTNTIPIEQGNAGGATVSLEGISGTLDVSVEQTFSRLQYGGDTKVFTAGPSALTDITADASAEMSPHATGIRLVCNSFTDTAELRMNILQDRNW